MNTIQSKIIKYLILALVALTFITCEDFKDETYELSEIDARAVASLSDTVSFPLGFSTGKMWQVSYDSTLSLADVLTDYYQMTTDTTFGADTTGVDTITSIDSIYHFIYTNDLDINETFVIEFPGSGDTTLVYDTTFSVIDTLTETNMDTSNYSKDILLSRLYDLPFVILSKTITGVKDTIRSGITTTDPSLEELYSALASQELRVAVNDTCYAVAIPGATTNSYNLFASDNSSSIVMYGLGLVRVNLYRLSGNQLELVEVQNMSISPELIAGYYEVVPATQDETAYAKPVIKFRYAWDLDQDTYLIEYEREETATSNSFRVVILRDE
ncbi:MAG: hypothetical protein U9Q77_09865 [Candidatus Marinimicrobia bacterium]|nr:hypothetical protein [Candidatus Neomarinimicrobiota bacterium]